MRRLAVLAAWSVIVAPLLVACDSGASGHDISPTLPPAHIVFGGTASSGAITLDLVQGVSVLRVATGETGGHLYRVSTPSGTASYPVVHMDGATVQVSTSGAGSAIVDVVVAASTSWIVRLSAGVSTASIDLRGASLRGLSALAGVSTFDVSVGAPHGNVVLSESGGVSAFTVHVPTATAVIVTAHGGAGSVSLFGATHSGVPAGGTFSSGSGANRYTIDARAGASSITVDSV